MRKKAKLIKMAQEKLREMKNITQKPNKKQHRNAISPQQQQPETLRKFLRNN